MIKVIAKAKNNKVHVEVNQNDLRLITGTNEEFEIGQEINVSGTLSVIHQLSRKKNKYSAVFAEITNVLNQL